MTKSYIVLDNFISKEDCEILIKDASFLKDSNYLKTHNGKRFLLSSSSIYFKYLIDRSNYWKNFHEKLNSGNLLDTIIHKFNIKKKFNSYNYFSNFNKINKNYLTYKNLGLLQINNLNTFTLIKYLFYRLYRLIKKNLFFSLVNFFSNQPLELLYDYSKAINGYKSEIHKDSYHRVFIFLLYLNKLEDVSKGGELKIYKNTSNTDSFSPDTTQCELCDIITPSPGKLVLMLNDNKYFHAVEEISNMQGTRNFIYGGYTILAGNNPFLSRNLKSTGLHMYE